MNDIHMVKYSMPVINTTAIHRKRLTNIMNAAPEFLYVHAPAGYGKTTAVIQWIVSKKYDAAWLSLDAYDKTLGQLCIGVLRALAIFADDSALKLIYELLENPQFNDAPIEQMLVTISRLSFQKPPDILVIDDFHLCDDKSAGLALRLLRHGTL